MYRTPMIVKGTDMRTNIIPSEEVEGEWMPHWIQKPRFCELVTESLNPVFSPIKQQWITRIGYREVTCKKMEFVFKDPNFSTWASKYLFLF